MVEKGKKSALSVKHLAVGSPYLAVFVGLYHFRSAWIAIGIYYAGIICAILLNQPKSALQQIFQGFRLRWAIGSAVLCFCICPLILLLWPQAKLPTVQLGELLQTYGLAGPSAILFALTAVSVNPLLEELFWRGLFSSNLRRPALVDGFFAGFHFFILILLIEFLSALSAILVLVGFSWAMRVIRSRLGGLAVPAAAHLAADAGILLAACLLLRQAG